MSKRTITLTNRPPVRIDEEQWPTLASASYHDFDNQYDFQANRHWRGFVRVRRHDDGRAIVYAKCSLESAFQGERDYEARAGELLDADSATTSDIIAAIRRMHGHIDAEPGGRPELWALLADECIADLPAEEI
jgi:hypothetical protein